MKLTYFSKSVTTPATSTAIVGSNGSLSADLLQPSAGKLYRFASWSDGGARNHNFTAPATPTTYTATYIPKRNLALNRPVVVSSVYTAGREGPKAVDGSMTTAWSSARSDPQWLRVDLGSVQVVNQVLLNWLGSNYGKGYQIQVSGSGRTWKTVYSTTGGDGGIDHLTFTPNYARYVQIIATTRGVAGSYYSLWEFGVFQDTGPITGIAGKCIDIYQASSADGTPTSLYTCHGNANQQWTQFEDGTSGRSERAWTHAVRRSAHRPCCGHATAAAARSGCHAPTERSSTSAPANAWTPPEAPAPTAPDLSSTPATPPSTKSGPCRSPHLPANGQDVYAHCPPLPA